MTNRRKVSESGVERLAREVFRQAISDWDHPKYQADVAQFLQSDWATELADLYGGDPNCTLEGLKKGLISPKTFRAEYRTGGIDSLLPGIGD